MWGWWWKIQDCFTSLCWASVRVTGSYRKLHRMKVNANCKLFSCSFKIKVLFSFIWNVVMFLFWQCCYPAGFAAWPFVNVSSPTFLRLKKKQNKFWIIGFNPIRQNVQIQAHVKGVLFLWETGGGPARAGWVDSSREASDSVCMRMARVLWTFCSFHPNSKAWLQSPWKPGLQLLMKNRPHAPPLNPSMPPTHHALDPPVGSETESMECQGGCQVHGDRGGGHGGTEGHI